MLILSLIITLFKIQFMNRLITLITLLSISGIFIFSTSFKNEFNKENTLQKVNKLDSISKKAIQNVNAVKVPKKVMFANELAPLNDVDVYERLDRELIVNSFRHSSTFLVLKRAQKFFPIIEPILKKNNVPEDFKYLAVIESDLTYAVSPAGARGIWQIMRTTGRELGLEVNSNVDERYHIEKSTQAACEYLKKSKELLGSWTLAAAAYNAGNSGISRRLKEQKVDNYYDLLLGEETGRYVFRILAIKQIMEQPELYGFHIKSKQKYSMPHFNYVHLDTAVTSLVDFSNKFGYTYKQLKQYNPWLREKHLNNKTKRHYEIRFPKR